MCMRGIGSDMADDQTANEHEPLTDLPRRRATHDTDEQGRQQVNNHGDVDVVRTPKSGYPVQLPLEQGAVVTIDGDSEVFVGFRKDALKWTGVEDFDPDSPYAPEHYNAEGVHNFNTRVRDATEVTVEYPEA